MRCTKPSRAALLAGSVSALVGHKPRPRPGLDVVRARADSSFIVPAGTRIIARLAQLLIR